MSIDLTDDGTLDTVLRCSECGEEFRFNYDGGMEPSTDEDQPDREQDALDAYDDFVDECIAEVETDHVCGEGDI
jgi:transcription elongation factor Elf1